MNDELKKLNCRNYQIHDSEGDYWYAQCGLRSLYEYSKVTTVPFKHICQELLRSGQIVIPDVRGNNNDTLCITMI